MEKIYDAKSRNKVILPDGEWDGGFCSEKKCRVPFNDFKYQFELDKSIPKLNAPCKVEVINSFAHITLLKNARQK